MAEAAESRLTQLHEGTPGLAWWWDRAVRRKSTSGASATGQVIRRATSAPVKNARFLEAFGGGLFTKIPEILASEERRHCENGTF